MDVVTRLERHIPKFCSCQFSGFAGSGFTVDHRIFYLVLRGLRNCDNSTVSTSQIVVRTSKGVRKEFMFIFKI